MRNGTGFQTIKFEDDIQYGQVFYEKKKNQPGKEKVPEILSTNAMCGLIREIMPKGSCLI